MAQGTLVDVDVLSDTRWSDLIKGSSGALFLSPRWLSILGDVYGFDFRARAIEQNGRLVSGFCYAYIDDPRGRRIVALPFCDFADQPFESVESWELLSSGLFDGEESVTFRTRDHAVLGADDRLETRQIGVSHEIDASIEPELALASFATLPRRMINRAPREGLTTGPSDSRESLRAFFDLHLGVRKYRHGLLAQPYDLFEQIAERFFDSGNGFVVGSWCDGEFAGGCVVLVDDDTAYYKFSASHPDYRKAGVSHVTLYEGLRLANQLGLSTYDLGRSDLDPPGLLEFKRRFRPAERVVTAHHRSRLDGEHDQLGAVLGELTSLLVRHDVPDEVTERAGQLLYRYFA